MQDVIVVGAGLGGLACARDLARAGREVLLLDKSRGVSGRAATRRLGDGVSADHGAQFFTARSERLRDLVDGWAREGWVKEWSRGFPLWESGCVIERPSGHPRLIALPSMSALGKHLARGLNVRTEATVSSVVRVRDGWRLLTREGEVFESRTVLFNVPAPQLAPLLTDVPLGGAGEALSKVRFDPTWTLILELETDLNAPWVALEVRHPVLSWVSRDHTKRGAGAPPTLVAHASGDWSRAHLEDERAEVETALLAALPEVVGEVKVKSARTHRWRFATPTVNFPEPSFFDPGLKLGWCGDWCVGGRVEGALESGWSLAGAVLETMPAAAARP